MTCRKLSNSSVLLFIDHCVIYKEIKTPQDAVTVQKDLDTLSAWEKLQWQMKFNPEKCALNSSIKITSYYQI